jgi:hypothetical protein
VTFGAKWRQRIFQRNALHLYTVRSSNFGAKRGDIFPVALLDCKAKARLYHESDVVFLSQLTLPAEELKRISIYLD